MAFLDYENKRGDGKKLLVHFDLPEDDDYHIHHEKDSSSSISSDDSSDDSDDDSEKNDDIIIDNLESKNNDGNGYGSPVWSYNGGLVTQSPPIQTMSPSGYDPNRIPSSIFSSPKPMEWSVQSNESLFSIHIGNTSFSRDHVFAINKSGELPSTNDSTNISPSMTLPTVQEVAHDDDNKEIERHSISSDSSDESASLAVEENDNKRIIEPPVVEVHTPVVDQTPKDHGKEVNQAKVLADEAKNYNSSVSYQSIESDRSFQFPILTLDGGRNSYSTVESEKQEKNEHQQQQQQQQQQQPEKTVEVHKPETENAAPKIGGRSWCFCISCSPCCF